MARKGHAPTKVGVWRGALCISQAFGQERSCMDTEKNDRIKEIISVTELSLAMLGFMYYYMVQLPEQRRALKPRQ